MTDRHGAHVERTARTGAARLWQVATDWPRHGDGVPATTVTGQGDAGVGQQVVAVTRIGPLRLTDSMQVTGWEPATDDAAGTVRLAKTGRVLHGEAVIEVSPLGPGRSRLTWSETIRPAGRWPGRVVGPVSDVGTTLMLRRLARSLVRAAERG